MQFHGFPPRGEQNDLTYCFLTYYVKQYGFEGKANVIRKDSKKRGKKKPLQEQGLRGDRSITVSRH
jgi:hypothetical protein